MESSFADMSIRTIRGIGDVKAKAFAGLGVLSVGDLLRFYPRDYQDRTTISPVALLSHGDRTSVVVYVTSEPSLLRKPNHKSLTRVRTADDTGSLTLVFFNQEYRARQLHKGMRLLVYGSVSCQYNSRDMVPEDLQFLGEEENPLGEIVPIYPAAANLSSREIAKTIRMVIDAPGFEWPEILPQNCLTEHRLIERTRALQNIHRPRSLQDLDQARKRIVFEEFFLLSIGLSVLKSRKDHSESIRFSKAPLEMFYSALPFALTHAQTRSIREAVDDMLSGEHPMNRLLQGDVGSGKTAVAAACCFIAAKNGYQSAVMAPTELLAVQHYSTLSALFDRLDISCALLTGSTTASERARILEDCESGKLSVLIGTHALLESRVRYSALGLTVCDEQHRFGVRQRSMLFHEKGTQPHALVMSATPIPRTLALVMYGDMDISVLDELPPGRRPVKTYSVGEEMRERIYAFMRKEIQNGRQAYIVCPLIENAEDEDDELESDLKPVLAYYAELSQKVFPDLSIAFLHGRMKTAEKDAIMNEFREGNVQILITTTVIEVGVDVPNATLMIVENAERFGLSQLHQLRGRVGRGSEQSYCVLFSSGSENAGVNSTTFW